MLTDAVRVLLIVAFKLDCVDKDAMPNFIAPAVLLAVAESDADVESVALPNELINPFALTLELVTRFAAASLVLAFTAVALIDADVASDDAPRLLVIDIAERLADVASDATPAF